jgi:hypothetical protein
MKKILAALLVLALVAPAFAISFTATDQGSGKLRVNYTLTAGEALRGMALKFTVTSGDAAIANTSAVALQANTFNTFIDYAFSTPAGYTVGAGHPLANPAAAGVLATFPATTFVVSLGYLDQAGTQHGLTASNFFDVTFAGSTNSNVTISADTLRGGIVGDTMVASNLPISQTLVFAAPETISTPTLVKAVNPGFVNTDVTSIVASATSSLGHAVEYSFNWGSGAGAYGTATQTHTYAFTATGTETVTVTARCIAHPSVVSSASLPMSLVRECLKSTATGYADWKTWNRPNCWCFPRQCRGDANGAKAGFWVQTADLNILKTAYNKADTAIPLPAGICADFNRAKSGFRVQTADLNILKLYYNKADSLTPVCPVTDYNFNTAP